MTQFIKSPFLKLAGIAYVIGFTAHVLFERNYSSPFIGLICAAEFVLLMTLSGWAREDV